MIIVQEYIESGILEDYCLGLLKADQQQQVELYCLLYPELKREVDTIKYILEKYTVAQSEVPGDQLMERVWHAISTIESAEGSKRDLWPLLTKYSDKNSWLQLLRPILPAKLEQDLFIKVLRDDDHVMQSVMWTKVNYPDEVHDDLQECFMILEGECECYVDEQVIILGPGDFFDVPLHAHHDVKIITSQVLAVVQRRRIA